MGDGCTFEVSTLPRDLELSRTVEPIPELLFHGFLEILDNAPGPHGVFHGADVEPEDCSVSPLCIRNPPLRL